MREDIGLWIANCQTCGAVKLPSLGTLPTGAPVDRLATDILGPLPVTPGGNRYILTFTDYFSKWVEIFAIPDQTTSMCASKILLEVIVDMAAL